MPEETKGNVEKKQARTYEELLAEQAELEEVKLVLSSCLDSYEICECLGLRLHAQCMWLPKPCMTRLGCSEILTALSGLWTIPYWVLQRITMIGLLQAEAPSDSDDEDEFVYNPLKLPLGYDGKPIPYWLYKLHGLNQVPPLTSGVASFPISKLA